MHLTHFLRLLDSHGADLARWPAVDAEAARALLARSTDAQAQLQRAAIVEDALRASRALPDAAALERMRAHVARHVARVPLPAPRGPLHWLRAVLPMGGGALAALAACGLWLMLARPLPFDDTGFNAPRQLAMIESTD
jgi:hypothetical protein